MEEVIEFIVLWLNGVNNKEEKKGWLTLSKICPPWGSHVCKSVAYQKRVQNTEMAMRKRKKISIPSQVRSHYHFLVMHLTCFWALASPFPAITLSCSIIWPEGAAYIWVKHVLWLDNMNDKEKEKGCLTLSKICWPRGSYAHECCRWEKQSNSYCSKICPTSSVVNNIKKNKKNNFERHCYVLGRIGQ